jgi:hypothetical protein
MTDSARSRPAWMRWVLAVLALILIWVLYPQLKDFGAEIYRLFA